MSRHSITNPAQRIELTERQEAVIRLIAKGLTNAEVAERLDLSIDGVKWHVREILGKYGVDSREEAVERWHEERSLGRRTRHWAGAFWGTMALRWAGGIAAVGAGLAGTAAMVGTFAAQGSSDDYAPASVAAPTPTPTPVPPPPPDAPTNQGLTLTVLGVRADDIRTVVDISLDGRPELGRLGNPALGGFRDAHVLTGPDGGQYLLQTYGFTNATLGRKLTLIFEPVPAGASWLQIQLGQAHFVAPSGETLEGQRPPDPTATVDGPWIVNITNIIRESSQHLAVDSTPRQFGEANVVLDQVIQGADTVLIRAHIESVGGTPAHRDFRPHASLVTAEGAVLAMTGGSWGNGPKEDLMEFEFPRISGPVTLRLQGSGASVLSPEDIEVNIATQGLTGARADDFRSAMEKRRVAAAAAGATFEGQPPAEWYLLLP